MIRTLWVAALLCVVCSSAYAKPRHQHRPQQVQQWSLFSLFETPQAVTPRQTSRGMRRVMSEGAGRVVSHPAGCPRRSFCGCGASVRVYGHSVRSLWTARAWRRFPRAAPSSGMVAVRSHHVFVLERHIGGSVWQVFDANSGHGRTRVHSRSIAGYQIVNPGAG